MKFFLKKRLQKLYNKIKYINIYKFMYTSLQEHPEEIYCENFLVISPHPDDETIGCGGLLTKFHTFGSVISVTSGDYGIPNEDTTSTIKIREKELDNALSFLDISSNIKLRVEDGSLKKISGYLDNINFDNIKLIFIPSVFEHHPDHKAIAWEVIRLISKGKLSKKVRILMYEVWTPLPSFNKFIDITKEIEMKLEALQLFDSQVSLVPYHKKVKLLNEFRGLEVGCESAEVYLEISYSELKGILNAK